MGGEIKYYLLYLEYLKLRIWSQFFIFELDRIVTNAAFFMLSVQEMKNLLGDWQISDKEIGKIRDVLYELAELALDSLESTVRQNGLKTNNNL